MKVFFITIVMLCMQSISIAQVIERELKVSHLKTTHVVFPCAIISGDCGTSEVIAQKMPNSEHILQVRSRVKAMPETNLTVLLENNQLYAFSVTYNEQHADMTVVVDKRPAETKTIAEHANFLLNKHVRRPLLVNSSGDLVVMLKDFHTDQRHLYVRYDLINNSGIDFIPTGVAWTISDRSQARRTARQELPQATVYSSSRDKVIRAFSSVHVVDVLPLYALSRSQRLVLSGMEINGSRTIRLRIGPKQLKRIHNL